MCSKLLRSTILKICDEATSSISDAKMSDFELRTCLPGAKSKKKIKNEGKRNMKNTMVVSDIKEQQRK
jgi:hypothetical protein